jgi:hypothetical protein
LVIKTLDLDWIRPKMLDPDPYKMKNEYGSEFLCKSQFFVYFQGILLAGLILSLNIVDFNLCVKVGLSMR